MCSSLTDWSNCRQEGGKLGKVLGEKFRKSCEKKSILLYRLPRLVAPALDEGIMGGWGKGLPFSLYHNDFPKLTKGLRGGEKAGEKKMADSKGSLRLGYNMEQQQVEDAGAWVKSSKEQFGCLLKGVAA